jgi:DNA topoisomerase IA
VKYFKAVISPPAQVLTVEVEVEINGEFFIKRSHSVMSPGWLALFPTKQEKYKQIPTKYLVGQTI